MENNKIIVMIIMGLTALAMALALWIVVYISFVIITH